MSDTPKAGEVWLLNGGSQEFTLVGEADASGYWCAWTVDHNGDRRNCIFSVKDMHRKPAAPPTDVECWTNYYPNGKFSLHSSAAMADYYVDPERTWRFDAYGNWVPCTGKSVLGPAVKGRP